MSSKNCFLLFLQTCQQAPYQQDAALAQPSVISVLFAQRLMAEERNFTSSLVFHGSVRSSSTGGGFSSFVSINAQA